MAKALRTAGIIVGAVALIATGVGAVAGVGTALAATASTVAGYATIAATALTTASAVTAKRPTSERQGLQTEFKIDPGGPIPLVVGRTAVGGTVVHRRTMGTDNHYWTHFAYLSLGPVRSISTLIDRAPVFFAGTSATGYYNRWLWETTQLGATPEAAALGHGVTAPPFGSIPGVVPGWGPDHRISGAAAVGLTALFDTKARRYANGLPAPSWIVEGRFVWDPRQDSSYPGGLGPCRLADPSTWVWSETPALHGLMWCLGHKQNGKPIMGVHAPIDLIDVAARVAAANVQEANGWTVGGELNSAMDKWEALKLIDQAGGSEPIPVGARLSILQKGPRVSIGTITDDMILSAERVPAMRPRRERLNGFRARFRSEAHGWEVVPIDIVEVAEYVTADGRPRTGSADYPLVQNADQAASLAAYEIFDSREIGPVDVTCKPEALAYRVGDCITFTAPNYGLANHKVIIRGRSIEPATGQVTLTIVTETDAKHAPALGQTGTVPPVPTLSFPPTDVPAPSDADWDAAGGTIDDGGYSTPALLIAGAVANPNADGVVFDYRQIGSSEWVGASIEDPSTTRKVFAGVLSELGYEVGIRYKVRGIIGDRLVLGPLVTGTLTGRLIAGDLAAIQDLLADGVLSRVEKRSVVVEYARIGQEFAQLVAAAAARGLSSAALSAAIGALDAYLEGLAPAWDDTTVDTPVDRTAFEARFAAYYSAAADLRAALDADSAVYADDIVPPAPVDIQCDHLGNVLPGQLPLLVYAPRIRRGVDITASSTRTLTTSGGVTATLATTPNAGHIIVTSLTGASETVELKCERADGPTLYRTLRVRKVLAPPPSTGGGVTTVYDTSLDVNNGASHAPISDWLVIEVGPSGTVDLISPIEYRVSAGAEGGVATDFSLKWIFSADEGATTSDVGSEQSASRYGFKYAQPEPPYGYIEETGLNDCARSKTGLTPGATVRFRLLGRRASSDYAIAFVTGQARASSS